MTYLGKRDGHAIRFLLVMGFIMFFTLPAEAQRRDVSDITELDLLDAVYKDEFVVAETLLELGVSPDAADYYGVTALMYAIMNENVMMVNLLLDKEADPNLADGNGLTPLFYALLTSNSVLKYRFLALTEDINHQSKSGLTALMLVAQTENVVLAQRLINMGADPECETRYGVTALLYAAAFGSFYMVDFLAHEGVDIHQKASDGSTALHLAAWYGHEEVMGLLLELGADLEMADNNGNTPVNYAILAGNPQAVWYLVESGANLEFLNAEELSPLALAVASQNIHVAELLTGYDYQEPKASRKRRSALAMAYYSQNQTLINMVEDFKGIKPSGLYILELTLNTGLEFNSNDLMYHTEVGITETRYRMHLKFSRTSRFSRKKLLVLQSPGLLYQYREKRTVLAMSAQRKVTGLRTGHHEAGFKFGAGLLYSYGDYKGSAADPPSGWAVFPDLDVFYRYKAWSLNGGYRFYKTGNTAIPAHRFSVQLQYNIPLFKTTSIRFRPVLR